MRGARALALLSLLWTTLAPPARAEASLVTEEALVPMSDGVRLYATVARVDDGRPRPVLMTGSPYGPDPAMASDLVLQYDQDFVVVAFHLRGTGASEGLFDLWGPRTQQDSVAMVDWAASQPWSNGSVVTFGGSGPAPWQYAPLSAHHPAVKAAMIFTTCVDFYRDCIHAGGASTAVGPLFHSLAQAGYLQALPTRLRLGLTNPPPPVQLEGMAAAIAEAQARGTDSEYWRVRSAVEEAPSWTVPVLYADGPFDLVTWNGVIEGFLRTPNAFLMLNGGHAAPVRLRDRTASDLVRFVRRFALGEPNGFDLEPRVQVFTGMGGRVGWSKGLLLERRETDYPIPGTAWTRLYLDAGPTGSARSLNDGSLALAAGTPGADVLPVTNTPGPKSEMRVALQLASIPPLFRQRIEGLAGRGVTDLADNALVAGDMRPEETSALTYTTGPLTQNLELTGEAVVRIFATATVPDLDIVVRITDVAPDGRSEWISDGRLRASMRRVDTASSRHTPSGEIWRPWMPFDGAAPLYPGDVNEFFVHVANMSNVFQAGHRIRVDVFATGQSAPDAKPVPGVLTVLRGPAHLSSVLLPVIPAGCNRSAPAFEDVPHPGPCAVSLAEALSP